MSVPQQEARLNENLLARIWACVNGVEVHNYDDLWVKLDTFEVGDVFLSPDAWEAFRAWRAERGLQSADEIKTHLEAYGFIPLDSEPITEVGGDDIPL